ncbi:MAG: DUF4412 domain-containing protein [Terriglobia bacterium]|nr:DUF4412 domain-containing protein [Terriglobia bacterium]
MKRLAVSTIPILLFAISAMAQVMPSQFSADMVTHTSHGDMKGKMFFGGTNIRIDMESPGGPVSNITDITAKKNYMVMHNSQMYMEHDLSKPGPMGRGPQMPQIRQFDPTNPCANRTDMTCKQVGSETVNGRSCDKWEFSKGSQLEETNWIDKKLHVPVKSVHADGTSWELQNIKEGAQPDKLFEIPAGYQKLDMGGMMRGMGRDQ